MKVVNLVAIALFAFCGVAQAAQTYTIKYAPNSPIKSVPLKNTTLVLEVYDYQKPDGYKSVRTNAKGKFFMPQGQDFEVVGIKGEKNFNARCSGFATPKRANILIRCEPF